MAIYNDQRTMSCSRAHVSPQTAVHARFADLGVEVKDVENESAEA